MNLLVAGTREDVAGFALAGIRGVVCATPDDVALAIARADEDALIFVSHEFACDDRRCVALPPRE